MRRHSPAYYGKALLAAALLILADQLTKRAAALFLRTPAVLIPGVLELIYTENTGISFGALKNAGWFIILFAAAALVFLAAAYVRLPENTRMRPLSRAVVLIAAGAAGNLIDRIRLGYVVDFIYIRLIHFPVFNVADCLITMTSAVTAYLLIFRYTDEDFAQIRKRRENTGEKPADADVPEKSERIGTERAAPGGTDRTEQERTEDGET